MPDTAHKAGPHWIWILLAALALAASGAALLVPAAGGNGLPAYTMPIPLIFGGLLFYLVWRRRGEEAWPGGLIGVGAGLFILAAALVLGKVVRERQASRQALAPAVRDAEDFARESRENYERINKGLPPAAEGKAGAAPAPLSFQGMEHKDVLPAILSHAFANAREIQRQYYRELAEMHLERTLSPGEITTKQGLANGRATLRRFEALLERHKAAQAAWAVSVRKDVDAAPLTGGERSEFFTGFDRSQETTGRLLEEFYAVEGDLIAAIGGLLTFMEGRLGTAVAVGNQINFVAAADVAAYNRLIGEIQRLAQVENEVLQRMFQNQERGVAKLKSISK